MDDVFQLNEQELFQKAMKCEKSENDWNRYFIYMTMSANRGYSPAIEKLIRAPFHKQDYKETFPFYEKTKNCIYSMEQLAAIYEKDRDFMQKKVRNIPEPSQSFDSYTYNYTPNYKLLRNFRVQLQRDTDS